MKTIVHVTKADIEGAHSVWHEHGPTARALRRELSIGPSVFVAVWKSRIQIGETMYRINPGDDETLVNRRESWFIKERALKPDVLAPIEPYSFTFDDSLTTTIPNP